MDIDYEADYLAASDGEAELREELETLQKQLETLNYAFADAMIAFQEDAESNVANNLIRRWPEVDREVLIKCGVIER